MFSLHAWIFTIVIYQQQEEKVAPYNRTHVGSLSGRGGGTETGLWGPELQKREKETERDGEREGGREEREDRDRETETEIQAEKQKERKKGRDKRWVRPTF